MILQTLDSPHNTARLVLVKPHNIRTPALIHSHPCTYVCTYIRVSTSTNTKSNHQGKNYSSMYHCTCACDICVCVCVDVQIHCWVDFLVSASGGARDFMYCMYKGCRLMAKYHLSISTTVCAHTTLCAYFMLLACEVGVYLL